MKDIKLLEEKVDSLIGGPGFQTKLTGSNAHYQAMWMNEARGYLVKCAGKLDKILEVDG